MDLQRKSIDLFLYDGEHWSVMVKVYVIALTKH